MAKRVSPCAFEIGTQAYLASLQREPGYAALLQGITDPVYLLGHVTAQRVLRRHPNSRLTLSKTEDTAFFIKSRVVEVVPALPIALCLVAADRLFHSFMSALGLGQNTPLGRSGPWPELLQLLGT